MAEIIRAMTKDGSARVLVINSIDIINRAIEIHSPAPTASAALGRTLTAASLMGSLMGNQSDLLTLRIKGDGPGGTIVASSDYMGNVRGFIQNPLCDLPLNQSGKLDVGGCVGKGNLYVLRDTGGKEPYVGVSDIVSGEIAEDIVYYYALSEQIPTACTLGVLIDRDHTCKATGGMLFQLLPFADEAIVDVFEKNLANLPPITSLLTDKTPLEVLDAYLTGIDYDVFDSIQCGYVCNCSRDKTDNALISLGKTELQGLLDSPEETSLGCQFCDKVYNYSKQELESLISGIKAGQ